MKRFKPNTILPRGAKLLAKPLKTQIGGWVEQTFDAKMKACGLTWLRVKRKREEKDL